MLINLISKMPTSVQSEVIIDEIESDNTVLGYRIHIPTSINELVFYDECKVQIAIEEDYIPEKLVYLVLQQKKKPMKSLMQLLNRV